MPLTTAGSGAALVGGTANPAPPGNHPPATAMQTTQPPKVLSIQVLRAFMHEGALTKPGQTLSVAALFARELISAGKARLAVAEAPGKPAGPFPSDLAGGNGNSGTNATETKPAARAPARPATPKEP